MTVEGFGKLNHYCENIIEGEFMFVLKIYHYNDLEVAQEPLAICAVHHRAIVRWLQIAMARQSGH